MKNVPEADIDRLLPVLNRSFENGKNVKNILNLSAFKCSEAVF